MHDWLPNRGATKARVGAGTGRRTFLATCGGLALGWNVTPRHAWASNAERLESASTHMGTQFKIVLYTSDRALARHATQLAFTRIAALDQVLSDYDPQSEAMRLCEQAGRPIPVSKDLWDALRLSLDWWKASEGAFDVTVNPVVRLWRRARRDRKLPTPEALAKARALVGSDAIHLDAAERTVLLARPGLKLDFGGIAKGFAADAALAVLRAQGITRALVIAAGDIITGDPPPDRNNGWAVDVESPGTPAGDPALSLRLKHQATSTSGDTAQFVEIEGRRYSHIVDPSTGLGVERRGSVTVVATAGADADALATSAFVLGPERGLALIDKTQKAAGMYLLVGPGGLSRADSRRWPELLGASRLQPG